MDFLLIAIGAMAVFIIFCLLALSIGLIILAVGAREGSKMGDLNDIEITDKRKEPRDRGSTY